MGLLIWPGFKSLMASLIFFDSVLEFIQPILPFSDEEFETLNFKAVFSKPLFLISSVISAINCSFGT